MADLQAFQNIAAIIHQDQNGEDTYSNDRALYGYIEATKYLRIPEEVDLLLAPLPAINVASLGVIDPLGPFVGANSEAYRNANLYTRIAGLTSAHMHRLALLNYNYLRDAGFEAGAAFLVAAFRARWVYLGCLAPDAASRNVTINEVEIDDMQAGHGAAIQGCGDYAAMLATPSIRFQEYITQAADEIHGLQFVTQYAETVWAISEYLFRVRGHHYKPEYDGLIKRMMKAASLGSHDLAQNFPYAAVFHTAIHPFGIKALPIMAFHFIGWGKVGNAMIMRTSGAPNGCAAITTAAAALNSIAGEAWFPRFASLHEEQITRIQAYAQIVLNNKYGYHLAANLYGVQARRAVTFSGQEKTMAQIDQEVSALAPALQAFINFSKEIAANEPNMSFSFQNAKVLEKRAASNPLLVQRTQALINYTIDAINASKDVSSAIQSTFPTLNAPAAAPVP